jgi:CheY-like chemotaxis protein
MSAKTVLIIDDSSTIRRLCDKELSNEGYRVITAPTAEEGVETALNESPDLIILDHQLPGKTGYEVAIELLASPQTAVIPVIASSTLRKKAYVEYVDCDNVVDMLPKPYTPEALIATVENAINTGGMVVQSQTDGSSVPEVINELGDADMTGTFACFGLREILDMLNNSSKSGALTVETAKYRVSIYVDRGRIQAVTANGVDPELVARHMPEALSELAPVIKFTVAGRRGVEIDGLVGLLDSKVLDPRLLKKLLRLQAAILLRFCFTDHITSFRFDGKQTPPHLFRKLPLDGSLLSFLVEGALICDRSELPTYDDSTGFIRKAIRGQNLDRAGLSSRHMKLMNLVSEAATVAQMASQLQWPAEEVQRVAHGFCLAELIEQTKVANTKKVFAVVADGEQSQKVRTFFQNAQADVTGKLVRDSLALRLLLRRSKPDVLFVEIGKDDSILQQLLEDSSDALQGVRIVGVCVDDSCSTSCSIHHTLPATFTEPQLLSAVVGSATAQTGLPVQAVDVNAASTSSVEV